jgi:protein SCO1/2
MSRTPSIVLTAVVAIVAVAAGIALSKALVSRQHGGPASVLAHATLLEPARPLPAFNLIDQSGAAFEPAALKNHWNLLFFGFTNCPDVCPTTLTTLAQTEKQLADLPSEQRPHVVMVSVDPKRDTPEQLAKYVKFFSPTFSGVTGTPAGIEQLTRGMGVPVAIQEQANGQYTVDHSAAIFLIDRNGDLRALFSTPHTPATIAADYRRIVTLQ